MLTSYFLGLAEKITSRFAMDMIFSTAFSTVDRITAPFDITKRFLENNLDIISKKIEDGINEQVSLATPYGMDKSNLKLKKTYLSSSNAISIALDLKRILENATLNETFEKEADNVLFYKIGSDLGLFELNTGEENMKKILKDNNKKISKYIRDNEESVSKEKARIVELMKDAMGGAYDDIYNARLENIKDIRNVKLRIENSKKHAKKELSKIDY
jgi:hypothetical protein